MEIPDAPGRILVVGTGLIGTSVGLAARAAGVDVLLQDADPERAALAARAGAGAVVSTDAAGEPDVVVIAVPPSQTGRLALDFLATTARAVVTHVSSVQTLPQAEVEASMPTTDRFVGGHPIAGRELSGPAYASTDLFRDRPWVVTPTSNSDPNAVAAVMGLARVCGARPVRLDAAAHDVLFAQLSHVPQLVASALAGTLTKLSGAETALAGAGIRDTTRLADSDPQLWAEIVSANAAPVAAGLRTVTHDLARLADALEAVSDSGVGPDRGEGSERGDRPAADAVRSLVERGRAGRAMLPGKHGGAPVAVQPIQVVVPDSPGALAELLAAVARERVNLEDLRVEHAPGQPLGLAELLVAPTAAGRLAEALRGAGWTVTGEPAG